MNRLQSFTTMFKTKVIGTQTVLSAIKSSKDKAEKIIADELNAFGLKTVNDAKRNAPVDEGALRNSIGYTKDRTSVTITVNVDYAAYLEFGTRSFAQAYVSSLPTEWQTFASQFKGGGGGSFEEFVMRITQWVKRKGIGATYNIQTRRRDRVGKQTAAQTAEADAYAIALYIIRKGIRPHPYLIPAVEKNRIELIKQLKAQL